MKKLMNLKQDKKGFTLIEIVIVLVIIAILAAMLIPSMMGWIDDSKKKSFLSEARSAMTAVESEIVVAYAEGETSLGTLTEPHWANVTDKTGKDISSYCSWTLNETNNKKIATFTYNNGTFTSTYTVADAKWSDPVAP